MRDTHGYRCLGALFISPRHPSSKDKGQGLLHLDLVPLQQVITLKNMGRFPRLPACSPHSQAMIPGLLGSPLPNTHVWHTLQMETHSLRHLLRVGHIPRLIECLPMNEALGLILNTVQARLSGVHRSPRPWVVEIEELEVIYSYVGSLGIAWATWDSFQKKKSIERPLTIIPYVWNTSRSARAQCSSNVAPQELLFHVPSLLPWTSSFSPTPLKLCHADKSPRNITNNTDPEVMVVGRAQDCLFLGRTQQKALERQMHRFLRIIWR